MTEPNATHPASHCPDAAHTLQWGLHPDSTTQGWILRHHDTVIAVLDGYPIGQPPVLAGEAREWADRILGTPQEWVEQPARSGAYHRHNSGGRHPSNLPHQELTVNTDLIYAPWTDEQVTALNGFQHHGRMHPFTCGAVHSSGRSPILVATPAEWICPDPSCDYAQDWAHAFMADPAAPVAAPPTGQAYAEAVQYWFDAATERRAERDRLRAVVARVAQMANAWEQQLPEVIRTPAVVSALRAALEAADDPSRLAAETPGPETQGAAHPAETYWQIETQWRSGDWHSWALRAEHDDALAEFERAKDGKSAWRLVRFHTTTAVEAEHQPDIETPDAPPVEPHPTEADLRHALAVLDRFEGRDTSAPAAFEADLASKTSPKADSKGEIPRRSRAARLLDAVTHSGPGYDLNPTAPAVVAEPGKEA